MTATEIKERALELFREGQEALLQREYWKAYKIIVRLKNLVERMAVDSKITESKEFAEEEKGWINIGDARLEIPQSETRSIRLRINVQERIS